MTSVYINYPNPHFSLEHGRTIDERIRHAKQDRRLIRITFESFETEIRRFWRGEIDFSSTRESNDLWLELEFGDELFERQVTEYIQRLLGRRYAPLAHAPWRP